MPTLVGPLFRLADSQAEHVEVLLTLLVKDTFRQKHHNGIILQER